MKVLNLGNNESISIGVQYTQAGWVALTPSSSKIFKTEKGAIAWLAKRGFKPDGSRV